MLPSQAPLRQDDGIDNAAFSCGTDHGRRWHLVIQAHHVQFTLISAKKISMSATLCETIWGTYAEGADLPQHRKHAALASDHVEHLQGCAIRRLQVCAVVGQQVRVVLHHLCDMNTTVRGAGDWIPKFCRFSVLVKKYKMKVMTVRGAADWNLQLIKLV